MPALPQDGRGLRDVAQDDKLLPLLNQLRSASARGIAQEDLGELYEQGTKDGVPEALVQCRHCRKTGEGYVMLQDDKLQPLLN